MFDEGTGSVLTWAASLVGGAALLAWTGRGVLSTPSLLDPAAWPVWAAGTEPVIVAVALLRLLALLLLWYLVGVTALALVARFLEADLLARGVQHIAVGPAATMVRHTLGATLAVGVVTSSTVAAPVAAPAGVLTAPTTTSTAVDDGPAELELPSLTRTKEQPDDPTPTKPARRATDTTVATTPDPLDLVDTSGPVEIVVRPGDHLWSIAETALRDTGAMPDEADVAVYWRQVVEANQHRLSVPNDPDLLLPGQLVVLPPVPQDLVP